MKSQKLFISTSHPSSLKEPIGTSHSYRFKALHKSKRHSKNVFTVTSSKQAKVELDESRRASSILVANPFEKNEDLVSDLIKETEQVAQFASMKHVEVVRAAENATLHSVSNGT